MVQVPNVFDVDGTRPRSDGFVFPFQLYTVSQDGALCVWESDTEPSGLVLTKKVVEKEEEEKESSSEEGEGAEEGGSRAQVIRGKVDGPKDSEIKNVRYLQKSK